MTILTQEELALLLPKCKPFKLRAPPPMLENDEAESLMQWARVYKYQGRPVREKLFMIPNGTYLRGNLQVRVITMGKMHVRGFRNGVFDYFLAIPKGQYHGLWLELSNGTAVALNATLKTRFGPTICLRFSTSAGQW